MKILSEYIYKIINLMGQILPSNLSTTLYNTKSYLWPVTAIVFCPIPNNKSYLQEKKVSPQVFPSLRSIFPDIINFMVQISHSNLCTTMYNTKSYLWPVTALVCCCCSKSKSNDARDNHFELMALAVILCSMYSYCA